MQPFTKCLPGTCPTARLRRNALAVLNARYNAVDLPAGERTKIATTTSHIVRRVKGCADIARDVLASVN